MTANKQRTFIVDCHVCKAKVAAQETGRAERRGWIEEAYEPYCVRLFVGKCPSCDSILAGESTQVDFKGYDSEEDRWTDIVRVYPRPPKSFSSYRIPRVVRDSLDEADRSLQANATIAACVMLGRALEAVCRDVLDGGSKQGQGAVDAASVSRKKLMLGEGINKLREKKIIDDRLYDWSQELQAFRNLAAHPEDIAISRDDAEDLQTFVYAIVEYIYDLADRYAEFRERAQARAKRKKS